MPSTESSRSVIPVIAFLDVDSFESQIWQRENPTKLGKPCVVANSSGRILAASYEAKGLGVSRILTPNVKLAKAKCPQLHIFWKGDKWGKQDQGKCRKTTAEIVHHIQDFLAQSTGGDVALEVASSDEFYLDISALVTRGMAARAEKRGKLPFLMPHNIVWEREREKKLGPFYYYLPHQPNKDNKGMLTNLKIYAYWNEERLMFGALFLNQLCEYLYSKTGLVLSGGVAKNKLLAKVGGSLNKPAKITVFFEGARYRVFKSLKIADIPGLGGSIGEQLAQTFKIQHMGEIRKTNYAELEATFGIEMTQRMWSWAIGQDVNPVLHKITKDQMKFNKPSGDIKNVTRLVRVLKDLTSEITQILEEEAAWYGRKTDQVRVDYKFEETDTCKGVPAGNEFFEINDPNLPERIMEYFLKLPDFDSQHFLCRNLTFTLKNFVPISSGPTPSVEEVVKGLTTLKINSSATTKLPVYSHNLVGSFRITTDLQIINPDSTFPQLVPTAKLASLVGLNLLKDFNPKTSCKKLIKDYKTYNEVKHRGFSDWIKDQKDKCPDVHFVTFQGRLLRALKTPLNKTWVSGRPMQLTSMVPSTSGTRLRKGLRRNLVIVAVAIWESFLNTWSPEERHSSRVNILTKLIRNLKVWSQAVVSGSKSVILGHKDGGSCITKIETLSIDELSSNLVGDTRGDCLNFVDRFLEWVKIQLPAHNPKLVKKFAWIPGNNKVICSPVPEEEVKKLIIPKFYF